MNDGNENILCGFLCTVYMTFAIIGRKIQGNNIQSMEKQLRALNDSITFLAVEYRVIPIK